jgi:hypothetical protein
MARGKKKVIEKIADVVDHAIHPEAAEPQAKTPYQDHMGKWESKAEKAKEKSSELDLDYAKHPKFHKFNSKRPRSRLDEHQ